MKNSLFAMALVLPLMLVGCNAPPAPPAAPVPPPPPAAPPQPPPPVPVASIQATATLAPTEGHNAAGTLILRMQPEGVRIVGHLDGVTAGTTHGFHVHETGDCSAPDASSAGPHFNPADHAHGYPGEGEHHVGDMPNLVADADGGLQVDTIIPGATLRDGGSNDIVGRALVLHAQADDYVTQPSGDSGARIACGVIE